MPKRILFLSKGENASSTRYRALQYFPLYKKSGYEPLHLTISGGLYPFIVALCYILKSDVVVLIRKTFPTPAFWLLRKLSKKLIFDFDDAIFCNTDGSYSKTRMSRFINTVKASDCVFAGNQYLADTAKAVQPNTLIIPTSLDTKKYNLSSKKQDDNFVLVWIGSKSTKKYISNILRCVEIAADSIPNLQLKIIADFELHSDSVYIKNVLWSESIEASEICSSDVGLAPLPADNWTKGKCALKVLQYMASSLPVITSPTSVNGYVVSEGDTGYLASTDKEWIDKIKAAYHKKDHLGKMGQLGRKRISDEFDIHVVFQKIIKHLSD